MRSCDRGREYALSDGGEEVGGRGVKRIESRGEAICLSNEMSPRPCALKCAASIRRRAILRETDRAETACPFDLSFFLSFSFSVMIIVRVFRSDDEGNTICRETPSPCDVRASNNLESGAVLGRRFLSRFLVKTAACL